MLHNMLAFDRKLSPRSAFIRARKVEVQYARQLRKLAANVGSFVDGFDLEDPAELERLAAALDRYSAIVTPWAEAVGRRMLAEVDTRDAKAWETLSSQMSRSLQREIRDAPTGHVLQARLNEQIKLITSLPTEAAQRVRDLTLEGLTKGHRPETIAKEIARTGEVTQSRANTIARTEVSTAASLLTQARAEAVGSTAYTWTTSHDSVVRPSHKDMDGKIIDWSKPPTVDGMVGHAGCFPNCRCWPSPILNDYPF